MNEVILQEISDFCRQRGLAESTFGRRAVNDGKLASRLRNGGRITTDTLERIRAFMSQTDDAAPVRRRVLFDAPSAQSLPVIKMQAPPMATNQTDEDPQRNFRFFDNRQKYLLFVNTCSEKWEVAQRVSLELENIHPRPPAVRVFDAGVGDGSVLARVMRSMHDKFPTMPHYIVGKEISLEDVRLTLEKMPDRFMEHPATVIVLTNLAYAKRRGSLPNRSPPLPAWCGRKSRSTATPRILLREQITALEPFLAESWKAKVSPKSGNPVYERPIVL